MKKGIGTMKKQGLHLNRKDIQDYTLNVGERYKITKTKRRERHSVIGECIENYKTYILFQTKNRKKTVLKADIFTGNYKIKSVS